MKKIFVLLVGLFLLPLNANAMDFKEGTHYEVLNHAASETPEVLEFFSFYCPHCYQFEPLIGLLKKELPDNVKIKKNHVNFLGQNMGPKVTQAYAAATILKIEDKITPIIFDEIHVQRKAIRSEQDIMNLFVKAGVSEKEAESAYQSFPANGIASQMRRNTEQYKITGVPTLIVNGKYKVIVSSIKTAKEFTDLIQFLTKKVG